MDYPKVLIISNNCFSTSGSNGRTLANLFTGWPVQKLAQFYIQNETPDSPVCNHYFRLTDAQAMKALIKGSAAGGEVCTAAPQQGGAKAAGGSVKRRKKTPFTSMLRNFVWNSGAWNRKSRFTQWVDAFAPEMVLLQLGDSAFMLKIATDLADRLSIPLVLYNSESYYFKNKNFMVNSGAAACLYPIYIRQYRRQFERTIAKAAYSVYLCEMLKTAYDKKFNRPGMVILNSTVVVPQTETQPHEVPVISYLGNLGVGRHVPLLEIASALQEIDSSYKLDVYGKLPNDSVKSAFAAHAGIRYRGFVPYAAVLSVMQQSDLLVHAENFSDYYRWDLQYAFSTKIADTLASGTCFFYYAPEELASTQYLLENQAACVVTRKDELQARLAAVLKDGGLRQQYISRACDVAVKNHDQQKNCEKFQQILCQINHKG